MDFFQEQDRAKRRTRGLVALFLLAVAAILLAVNAAVLLVLGRLGLEPVFSTAFLWRNGDVLVWTTLLAGGLIGFASLFRTLGLRAGGGAVARSLGGTLIEPDTADPLRRRLRNVVEEIAVASGVPAPEVYVLEGEEGLNAFAAGHSPADAAVAVTSGALENLDRAELQGVVAHEFGHVLNGDMRMNIRLIGVLFGILVLALIGRQVLFSMRYSRGGRGAAGVAIIGLALLLIGYLGLFFGRWIKASVSRQREYLADAAAVQLTRLPQGIGGALKKIAAAKAGSALRADTEEVGHMLFAPGLVQRMFATHPPILDRIRAIEPGFDPAELEEIRARMRRHSQALRAAAEEVAAAAARPARPPGRAVLALDPESLIREMGRPGPGRLMGASLLVASLPEELERAAHRGEWAAEVVCYLLMDRDPGIREAQLAMVREALGGESEAQVRALLDNVPEPAPELRIPLLEITFPALRRRPVPELEELSALVERLIHADGRVDAFEYALARQLTRQLEDAVRPARARTAGRRRIGERAREVHDLLSILALHGRGDKAAADAAVKAGLEALGMEPAPAAPMGPDWPDRLDAALVGLDGLRMEEKKRLLRALAAAAGQGGGAAPEEAELLRAVCASLHLPLPVLAEGPSAGP